MHVNCYAEFFLMTLYEVYRYALVTDDVCRICNFSR